MLINNWSATLLWLSPTSLPMKTQKKWKLTKTDNLMPKSRQNLCGSDAAGKRRMYHTLPPQRAMQRKALCIFLPASPRTVNVYNSQESKFSFFIVVAYLWSHSQVPPGFTEMNYHQNHYLPCLSLSTITLQPYRNNS